MVMNQMIEKSFIVKGFIAADIQLIKERTERLF